MGKRISIVLILVLALTTSTGFVWSKVKKPMSVQFNVKDLPEHGLMLVGPAEHSFAERFGAYTKSDKGRKSRPAPLLAVFVINNSDRNLVAYALKWELLRADGRLLTSIQVFSSPGVLMGEGLPSEAILATAPGEIIRPHSSRFITLAASPEFKATPGVSTDIVSTSSLEEAEQMRRTVQENDPSLLAQIVGRQQTQFTNVTVSLDGAFFDDGTFVGPDTSDFFGRMQAQIEAKQDILRELALVSENRKTKAAAFNELELAAIAGATAREAEAPDLLTNPRGFWRKVYANEFLKMKSSLGAERALALALQPHQKLWPVLRKHGAGVKRVDAD